MITDQSQPLEAGARQVVYTQTQRHTYIHTHMHLIFEQVNVNLHLRPGCETSNCTIAQLNFRSHAGALNVLTMVQFLQHTWIEIEVTRPCFGFFFFVLFWVFVLRVLGLFFQVLGIFDKLWSELYQKVLVQE